MRARILLPDGRECKSKRTLQILRWNKRERGLQKNGKGKKREITDKRGWAGARWGYMAQSLTQAFEGSGALQRLNQGRTQVKSIGGKGGGRDHDLRSFLGDEVNETQAGQGGAGPQFFPKRKRNGKKKGKTNKKGPGGGGRGSTINPKKK